MKQRWQIHCLLSYAVFKYRDVEVQGAGCAGLLSLRESVALLMLPAR